MNKPSTCEMPQIRSCRQGQSQKQSTPPTVMPPEEKMLKYGTRFLNNLPDDNNAVWLCMSGNLDRIALLERNILGQLAIVMPTCHVKARTFIQYRRWRG